MKYDTTYNKDVMRKVVVVVCAFLVGWGAVEALLPVFHKHFARPQEYNEDAIHEANVEYLKQLCEEQGIEWDERIS